MSDAVAVSVMVAGAVVMVAATFGFGGRCGFVGVAAAAASLVAAGLMGLGGGRGLVGVVATAAAAVGSTATTAVHCDFRGGGHESAADEVGNEGVGGEEGCVLDGNDADFQEMIGGLFGDAMAEDDLDAVLAEDGRRAAAAGFGNGFAADVADGAGLIVDVIEGEKVGAGEFFGEGAFGDEGDRDTHAGLR